MDKSLAPTPEKISAGFSDKECDFIVQQGFVLRLAELRFVD